MDMLARLDALGQHRLVRYLRGAAPAVTRTILDQLSTVDLDLFFSALTKVKDEHRVVADGVAPCEVIPAYARDDVSLRAAGVRLLKAGKVGYLLMAGGQGSRLGFEHPKGLFPIGAVSEKSLFQIHLEKISACGRRNGFEPHVFIMTSQENNAETESFLRAHNWFGLENVHLFPQGMLPAADRDGQLILAKEDQLFLAPDGHGGVYRALSHHRLFDLMRARGVEALWYFQVDNPLVDLGDPAFVAQHFSHGSDFTCKVIRKRDAAEGLGIPVHANGRVFMIEYSEMPQALAESRGADGELAFSFGSIGIHLIGVSFAERIGSGAISLPFHEARKKIPHFDPVDGAMRIPSDPNGTKLEQFVFDAIPHARNPLFVETLRSDEFSPLKNRTGQDSIETCRRALSEFHRLWLERAGLATRADAWYEISPLFACCEEELRQKAAQISRESLAGERVYLS